MQKRPTWQRSCISDLPSACQPSSRGNIAKKTQKQAVSYRRRSHGNRPAEGAPVPTLICTDSPLPDSSAEWWWWWGALSRGGLLISVSDLSCEVPRGGGNKKKRKKKRTVIPGIMTMMRMGLRCPPLPPLDKEHASQVAGR